MAAELFVSPRANDHIGEAADWYEERQAGLGDEFLVAVEHCLEEICEHPLIFKPVDPTFRRALVDRFP